LAMALSFLFTPTLALPHQWGGDIKVPLLRGRE